ncbi:MAG: O-antigen ligase family protein, partial [Actinobacteria bacterium]|nr:O-antigen ligase family protein [Actinomycetota bacterium]
NLNRLAVITLVLVSLKVFTFFFQSFLPVFSDVFKQLAAALLLCLVLLGATLFPENFVAGVPIFASQRSFPLSLLLPFVITGTVIYFVARRKLARPGMVDLLVVLFLGYFLIRNAFGLESLAAFKYFIYGLAVFYLAALLASRYESLLMMVMHVVLGLIIVTALYGLAEYAAQKNFIYATYIGESVREPAVGLHRVGSTLAHPVSYGAFIIQVLPFSVLMWLQSRGKVTRIMAIAATVLGILALFFTYSKGSWIAGMAVAVGALLLLRGGKKRKYLLPVLMVAALVASLLLVFSQQVISETQKRGAESVDVRLSTWEAAIDGFKSRPLAGVGFKQGPGELKKYIDSSFYAGLYPDQPVDNQYLSLLLEQGIAGFLLWMAALAYILVEGVRLARTPGPGRPWAIAALASVVAIGLDSVTFESMQLWPNFVFFWLAAGILHGWAWRRQREGAGYGNVR